MPIEEDQTPRAGFHSNFHKGPPVHLDRKEFVGAVNDPALMPNEAEQKPRPSFIGGLNTAPIVVGGGLIGLVLGESFGSADLAQWIFAAAGVLISLVISYEDRKRHSETEQ